MNKKLQKYLHVSLVLCVVAVVVARVAGNTGILRPMHILTSGFEEESMYAIWKCLNGQPVYADPHNIPFAASYFNWLFYYSYAGIIGLFQSVLGFGDEWIPQAGRYISLAGAVVALLASVAIAKRMTGKAQLSLLGWSVFISFFLGYLVGFWLFTVRPDVWATTFEVLAFFAFVAYNDKKKLVLLLLSAILFYISWGFKHNFIAVAGACWLFLVIRKRYMHAGLFAAVLCVAIPSTIALGTEAYRYLLIKSQMSQGINIWQGIYTGKKALLKSLNVTVPLMLMGLILLLKYSPAKLLKKILADDYALVLTISLLISAGWFFFFSMKPGSSDNYYFSPVAVCAILLVYLNDKYGDKPSVRNLLPGVYGLASVGYIALGLLILTGRQGVLAHDKLSQKYYAIAEVTKNLNPPVYVEKDNFSNLPWLNKSRPNFVVATTYYILRTEPQLLERNGIEGLMRQGYFESIVNIDNISPENKDKYLLTDSVVNGGITMYVWKKKVK